MKISKNRHRRHFRTRHWPRRAFTLLEVILALALSVVIVAAIGMSVYIHMATLMRQQNEIEQKQIARSVIMMINNDVRAAIQYKPEDYSGLDNLIVSQAMIAGIADAAGMPADGDQSSGDETGGDEGNRDEAGGGQIGGGDDNGDQSGNGSSGGGSQLGGSSNDDQAAAGGGTAGQTGDASMEESVSCRPTLLGNAHVLMVDVSRLPRLDQYNPLVANNQATVQLPSDVKAITYFFSEVGSDSDDYAFVSASQGGLYRRQIDRAVAAFKGETDLIDGPDEYTQLIAAEVADIAFRYFDGEQWQNDWDSEADRGFPSAIEVSVVIDPQRAQLDRAQVRSPQDQDSVQLYRTVIHLPVAEVLSGEQSQAAGG